MTAPTLIYPTSFSATASLSLSDCARLDQLTSEQRAELETGFAYIRAINHPAAPRRRKIEPLPADFRAKISVYCEALMARKTGIPAITS